MEEIKPPCAEGLDSRIFSRMWIKAFVLVQKEVI
jgi:hypothetical protein